MGTKKSSRQHAIASARICDDKKAFEIVLMDVRKLTYIADFFVICTVQNERQAWAIAGELETAMKREGRRVLNASPGRQYGWIIMDFGDIVAHVFTSELRKFYDIESLWADAPKIAWEKKQKAATSRALPPASPLSHR